ncbi:hypothetical protein C8R45DRAFT_542239 [Mycena sanguinolenta]|nr:hypothetical protein C8R45DRAFT_542239 [Mycena sanguinolenta]
MHNGGMSSYSESLRPSGHLSASAGGSVALNDSVDDYGQAILGVDLDLSLGQDVEMTPWLESSPQEPPSPQPKNGRYFHSAPEGTFSSRDSESHRNLGIADSATNGRLSPVIHLASTSLHLASTSAQMPSPQPADKDITPWLETLDKVPPTPPPKPSRTFNVSPQTSLSSIMNGSMSSYSSNGTRHRPSGNLSVSTSGSLELNNSVDNYGQAFLVPDLDLPPTQEVEIAPWLDTSPEPPSPPPKNSRSFHFPPKSSFSSLRPGSSTSLFSRSRTSESRSNLSIADSTIASTSTSMMHEPRDSTDRSFSPSPELRKTKSSVLSSLRTMFQRKSHSSSNTWDEYEHPALPPPPPNISGNLVSFLPIPSPPTTRTFKRKKNPSQFLNPPWPTIEPLGLTEQELRLDTNFDRMEGIVDIAVLANGRNNTSPPSELSSSSGMPESLSDHSQYEPPLTFKNPGPPEGGTYRQHKETRHEPTAAKRSERDLRSEDDDLDDKQQIDSIDLVDAFLDNQQRRAALVAQVNLDLLQ